MNTVFQAIGGAPGVFRLATACHDRVMADEVVSRFQPRLPLGPTVWLATDSAEASGGPADETTVVRMHSGNGPHEEMDRGRSRASTRRELRRDRRGRSAPTSAPRVLRLGDEPDVVVGQQLFKDDAADRKSVV